MSVRGSIQRAVAGVAEREKSKNAPVYDSSFLYKLKAAFEPHFREDPEGTVARIRKDFALEPVIRPFGKREFVSEWLAQHGYSDKDAADMRRRINAHRHSDEGAA